MTRAPSGVRQPPYSRPCGPARCGSVIELSAYRDIGGLGAALARRAEAIYHEFEDGAKEATRQVLLRLIALGEGTEDVRRRVLRQELLSLGEPDVEAVLDAFGTHRLLSFDRDPVTRGPTVEIAHEALLAEWDRLRGWIDANREDVRQQRRLAAAADEWQAAGRDADYLLSGTKLDQLAAWAALTDLSLDPGERAILDASIDRRNQGRAEEEARRRDEERLRLRTRGRTRLLIASGTILVIVAGLAGLAFIQRNAAERLAEQLAASDQAGRLASASGVIVESDPDTAMLLALQSLDSSARAGIPARLEAEEALHWALQAANVPYPSTELPVEVRSGPFGPTGIVRLPLDDLVALAQTRLGERSLTDAECAAHDIAPCPRAAAASTWPANGVWLSLCKLRRDTMDAGLQRFDASDHMPEAIGGDWLGGVFMQGMVDYIAQGPDSLDEVLADIEAARRGVMAQTDP